jgi:uncharacterized membrane protein YfcA
MLDSFFILSYLCLIIAFQSSIGVGVLVLGTPFLLILNYNILEIFFILLPLSIITSLLNLIIFKFFNKKFELTSLKEIKKFFLICMPSIILGLLILKFFQSYINFRILVSIVIIISVFFVFLRDKITFRINFFRISVLSIIGVVHGLTNSGGTLMSLALSTNNKKDYSRLNISFFYFVLASFQYILIMIIFNEKFFYPKDPILVLIVFFGVLIGNIIYKYINEKKYKWTINLLALISAVMLLINF